jgi:hypothetical protein
VDLPGDVCVGVHIAVDVGVGNVDSNGSRDKGGEHGSTKDARKAEDKDGW